MADLIRFGVSLERDLLRRFDEHIKERLYDNRSEAIRDLIRRELVARAWSDDQEVAGAITFLYDHHDRELLSKITDIQHDYQDVIISTQHIHLDHDHCLEIVAVRGNSGKIKILADKISAVKGVHYGSINMASTKTVSRR
ncbi:MAG: nickel-responsive transcriptional regulator NikR [Syntrophales bacterium]|nr:nickel-responsive transcriptional regulator NikR [Syntrophales bacterium]